MTLLLRTVRQNRWYRSEADPWLIKGDVPADPLGDLATNQNRLSVWEVATDRANIERIVRAVAVGRDRVADMGYVLFDSTFLPAGISIEQTKGTTPDEDANAWHRDLVDLSGSKLVALTKAILENGESDTLLKRRLLELIEDGIQAKELPERLRSKLAT